MATQYTYGKTHVELFNQFACTLFDTITHYFFKRYEIYRKTADWHFADMHGCLKY
jgi:hypothetical protein